MKDTWDSEDRHDLERALRDEALSARGTPRPSVAERVMSALPERAGARALEPSPEHSNGSRQIITAAVVPDTRPTLGAFARRLAAAAALVAGLYGLWNWDTVERSPAQSSPAELAQAPRRLDRLQRLKDVDVTLSNPLLDEARRLGLDASSATDFLASRLPPTFRSALLSEF